jgi:hypothetical protein
MDPNTNPEPDSMQSVAKIQELPAELIQQIAALLPPEDWINIRQTCQDIAAKTKTLPYYEICFIISDEHSMEILDNITTDPELCKAIRRLWFVDFKLIEGHSITGAAVDPQWNSMCRDLVDSSHDFVAYRLDLVLEQVMQRFQQAGAAPDIRFVNTQFDCENVLQDWNRDYYASHEVVSGYINHFQPIGIGELTTLLPRFAFDYKLHTRWGKAMDEVHCGTVSEKIFGALAYAPINLTKLDLGDACNPIHMRQFQQSGTWFPSQLEELRLWISPGPIYDIDDHKWSLGGFVMFMCSLDSLRYLFLNVDPRLSEHDRAIFHHFVTRTYHDHTPIESALRQNILPKIKRFELVEHHEPYLHTVLEFLREHRETLKDVKVIWKHNSFDCEGCGNGQLNRAVEDALKIDGAYPHSLKALVVESRYRKA